MVYMRYGAINKILVRSSLRLTLLLACSVGVLSACFRAEREVVIITATFLPPTSENVANIPTDTTSTLTIDAAVPTLELSPMSQQRIQPTPNPQRSIPEIASEHVVQVGDTLSIIAQRYNVSLDSILAENVLMDPNIIEVGQVIRLPDFVSQRTPNFKIIPDSRLVRSPGSSTFDVQSFISQMPGYVRFVTDEVTTRLADGSQLKETLTGAQIIDRIALEYSIDPRLLLALLEYRAGWLSNPDPSDAMQSHPLIRLEDSQDVDRSGLYRQLAWVANELNRGYYGWKYRGLITLELTDGARYLINPELNPGTIAIQYFSSLNQTTSQWQLAVGENGVFQTYYAYFGDPFAGAVEPLVPQNIAQPPLTLPFSSGEVWFYTGGHHGGWGSGSAWAAVDFAPPDERQAGDALCYTSQAWVRSVAPGVIARSGDGVVVLDLDGDGDESTGWSILYLHLASDGLAAAGQLVVPGDTLGRASCAGGFSTATHLHIARRFNGEWIPADCQECIPGLGVPPFIMSGWRVVGIPSQQYQGFLDNSSGVRLQAEQGRSNPLNRVSW